MSRRRTWWRRAEGALVPIGITAAFIGAFGAAIGSFLNVVAYRLPRRESLIRPASRCPGCGAAIKAYDNVPVLGWLMLRGRCRNCATAISPRYPLVEALTAALSAAVVLVEPTVAGAVLGLALVVTLLPIALIDLDHQIIPNKLTGPAALLAVGVGLALRPSGVAEQLIAGAAAATFLLVFVLAYPRGMGMGDVKLAGVLGLFLGRSVAVAILLAVLTGAIAGGVVMARVGVARGRKTKVPFGPFLALGGVVALFAGPAIVHWYLHAGL
jgi:leader peptidase (prepilin peptidase)/N-methyltransferase